MEIIGTLITMDNSQDVYNSMALRIRAGKNNMTTPVLVPGRLAAPAASLFMRDVRATAHRKDNHLWLEAIEELD